ncbi:Embryo defective 2737 [Citrus sinensis]|uniref:Embryo defective 2737 n=1 Tax=Citrus sinensis TaxID=2711 RepID=A0ACB8NXL9_CITSI|nr:Embryo defective 2737 [Citrus sinensis]
MSRGSDRFMKSVKQFTDFHYKQFTTRHGQQLIDIFEFPIKLVLSPFTLAFDIAGSAPRGFGVPELISKLSYVSVFAVAAIGTYDIAFELGKKALSDMQRMAGIAVYHVPRISGEKATAEHVADAIADNRAELVHLPSTIDLNTPLPSKDCPTCDGTGVMGCPECKNKLQVTISADDIMEPPWKAYNVLRKMDYPYEHIVESMRDPSIAAFWLMTFPQIVGGFDFDDEVKQKIWWQYKESMRYDQLRELVAKRSPGWEHLQEALIPIDPVRAREDPVIVKNIPYYKAKKALETEVMKLDPPPRPENWGVLLNRIKEILLEPTVEHLQDLDLPLNASSWSEDDLKDPKKLYEKTVLLNAQREIADKMLDAQWETKWRQEKLNEMLEEKVRPFMQNIDNAVLSRPILMHPQNENKNKNQKKARQKRWWFF